MSDRKCPYESASNYKVGKIKTGIDAKEWIVTKDKNGVIKWVRHHSIDGGKKLFNAAKFFGRHTKKSKNSWYNALPTSIQKQIDVVRSTYKSLNEIGIRVFEYILHLSEEGIYFIDEPWAFYHEKYPRDDTPVIMPIIKVDSNETLDISNGSLIRCHHSDIKKEVKKKFISFIKEFNNSNDTVQIEWDFKVSHTINFKLIGVYGFSN